MMTKKEESKQFLAAFIKPEVTSEVITLQPTEVVNPYERMGPVPSVMYSGVNRPGNPF
jgi:hypothetical protein